jgi:cysteine desulfurase
MIYLDNMASTPLDPRVRSAMDQILDEGPGNPHATTHAAGWRAGEIVDEARRSVARAISAKASDIIFTSGATEANNLAIRGAVAGQTRRTIVVSQIEHPCVREAAAALTAEGFGVLQAPVSAEGVVNLDALADLIDNDTALVSIMLANNEIGSVQPLADIAAMCAGAGALLHTDAAQAFGRLPLDVGRLGVDFLSLSAHKAYGPMGIGALYVRDGATLEPIIHGGGQQGGKRAGTIPVALAHGLAAAAELAGGECEADFNRLSEYSDSLYERLSAAIPDLVLNGPRQGRLPGCVNISVPGLDAEAWLLACPGIAAATGAACASGDQKPSYVLRALGTDADRMAGSVRLSFGRFSTRSEVDDAADLLIEALAQVFPSALERGVSPVSQ